MCSSAIKSSFMSFFLSVYSPCLSTVMVKRIFQSLNVYSNIAVMACITIIAFIGFDCAKIGLGCGIKNING